MRFPVLTLSAALLLPALAAAQTGPWADGELIVHSNLAGAFKLYRVDPESGQVGLLASPQYYGGWSGGMAFDRHRGGLLANISLPPDNPFLYRLWLISHDGTAAAMPGLSGSLRALCPTGDGRVFFMRNTSVAQGPATVEYFDAANQIRTLKQADGVTPFQIEVEHLLYDPASQALIGSSSAGLSATDCSAVGSSVYRIPLSADGLRVDGPVTCNAVTSLAANEYLMSLARLPDGDVLVTVASGNVPSTSTLLRVDPVTLAASEFADPMQAEIEGGVWSSRLGKVVLHAAWTSGYELRSFTSGSGTNLGGLIPTSLPIAGWGGFTPSDDLFEVDLNGAGCEGFQLAYGAGLAGKSAQVPLLGAIGCPDIGHPFTISINSVVGGAFGVLFVGLAPGATPFKGGTFHLGSIALQVPITVGGAPGAPGAGALALPVVLSNPVLSGVNLYLQGAFADSFAVQGASLTNGLRIQGD